MKKIFTFILMISVVSAFSFAKNAETVDSRKQNLPLNAYGQVIPKEEVEAFLNTSVITLPASEPVTTRMVSDGEDENPTIVTIQNVIDWAAKASSQLNLPAFVSILLIAIGNVISFITNFISWIKERKKE